MKDVALNPGTDGLGQPPAAVAHDAKVGRRAVIAASTGNALEWYDFTVYALFAVYIGQNFSRTITRRCS